MTEKVEKQTDPAGGRKTIKQALLETGADVLQDTAPVSQFDIYVAGFHCAKGHADTQMHAHHYCRQVNADLMQCVLFDGNTADANLIGVEYIVSERLFETLPADERRFWHPHNFEVLSGTLVAPGLPETAEKALMKQLVNSYGKTWHLWNSGRPDQGPGDPLPLGEAALMWSFNREGELEETLRQARDAQMQIDKGQKIRSRADLADLAHPQVGVDALEAAFPNAKASPPGVRDAEKV